jgi:hypothetical protein
MLAVYLVGKRTGAGHAAHQCVQAFHVKPHSFKPMSIAAELNQLDAIPDHKRRFMPNRCG